MVWREDAWEYPLHGLRRCGVDVLLALPCWPLFVCLYWVRYDWICHVGGMLSVVGEAPSLVVTSGTCLVVLSYPLCLLSLPGLCTPGCPADSAFISTFVVLAPVGGGGHGLHIYSKTRPSMWIMWGIDWNHAMGICNLWGSSSLLFSPLNVSICHDCIQSIETQELLWNKKKKNLSWEESEYFSLIVKIVAYHHLNKISWVWNPCYVAQYFLLSKL